MKSKDQILLEEAYQQVVENLSAESIMASQIKRFMVIAGQDKAKAQKSLEPKLPLTSEEKIKTLQDLARKTGGVIKGGVYMGDVALKHNFLTPEEKQRFDELEMPDENED